MKKGIANILLILAAFIWGVAFTAQSVGMDYLGPMSFNGIRFILGGLVLIPVIVILRNSKVKKAEGNKNVLIPVKNHLKAGYICGVLLAVASALQQIGIIYTSPGKAGFITALYVIIVPIIGLFIGKKANRVLWVSACIAVVGMYFLCLSEEFSLSKGDFFVLCCALCFSFHILVVDKYAPELDGVLLSSIQFFVAGLICLAASFIAKETITIEAVKGAAVPILYTGILSSGVAYTLQIVGQQHTSPVLASLLLSLESVFAAVMAWVLIGEAMSFREIIGGLLCFTAIILAQIPVKNLKKKSQAE